MGNFYIYNEITYNKGYELGAEDIYNAMDRKTTTLTKSQEALDSFINCIEKYNEISEITIDKNELKEVCNSCLLVEGCVLGVNIDYEKLFDTYKNTEYGEFLKYLYNIREAISLCILNELGKDRTELEYAISLNNNIDEEFEEFKQIMEELFEVKNSDNKTYKNIDSYLDDYLNDNLMNLQRNIVSGNLLLVAKNMLKKAKE